MLREKVDSCQGLLQIVGVGYGFSPPSVDPEFGEVSYTQYEFLYARQTKKETWLIIAKPDCSRDTPVNQLDLPAESEYSDPRQEQLRRRELQKKYRESLEASEHIFHLAENDDRLELHVERMRDELKRLRTQAEWSQRRTRQMQIGILLLLLAIGAGGWWAMQNQSHSINDMKITLQEEVQKILDSPQKLREQLEKSIQETYQQEYAETGKVKDWVKREKAREVALARRDKRLSEVDGFLTSITTTIQEEKASKEFLELTRILTDQGVDETLEYIASHKKNLLEKARHIKKESEPETRKILAPLLEEAKLLITKGEDNQAFATCEQIYEIDPHWTEALHLWHQTCVNLSNLLIVKQGVGAARPFVERGMKLAMRYKKLAPARAEAQRDLALSHNLLGKILEKEGQLAEAKTEYTAGLNRLKQLFKKDQKNTQTKRDLSISYDHLGDILQKEGDLQESKKMYQAGLNIRQELISDEPENTKAHRDLSVSYLKIGGILFKQTDANLTEVKKMHEAGLDIRKQLAKKFPKNTLIQRDLSISYVDLGSILLKEGKLK